MTPKTARAAGAATARREAIDELTADPRNANAGTDRGRAAVEASLRQFGAGRSILVDKHGVAIAGNKTLEAAKAAGFTSTIVVPTTGDELVIVQRNDLDLRTDAAARALAIADNRASELGLEWNLEELAAVLADKSVDLSALFTTRELVQFLAASKVTDGLVDPDVIPAPPDAASCARGDLWQLGPHRLLCGDAGEPADLDRLLDGATIDLVHTDPPYNVRVEPRSNNAIVAARGAQHHHQEFDEVRQAKKGGAKRKATHDKLRPKDRSLTGDFIPADLFDARLLTWCGQMARVLKPGGAFYLWGGYSNVRDYPPAIAASGLYYSQAIIWNKQHPVLTRKDYLGAYEIAFYGWREGGPHRFYGPPNIADLWDVKKMFHTEMVHMTEKPVEIPRRVLTYSSTTGETVLDLFGGSGSTLIAAQQLDRIAYLMELDPIYCDVIVDRWQTFTGLRAERISHGRQPTQRPATRTDGHQKAARRARPRSRR